jgi:hypothetical protein
MAPPGEVDGQILRQRHFVVVFQHNRLADGQVEPPGPVEQDIRSDEVQHSLVLLLADLTQAAVAGQDLRTGHQRRPWQRRAERGLSRAQKRGSRGEQAAQRPW